MARVGVMQCTKRWDDVFPKSWSGRRIAGWVLAASTVTFAGTTEVRALTTRSIPYPCLLVAAHGVVRARVPWGGRHCRRHDDGTRGRKECTPATSRLEPKRNDKVLVLAETSNVTYPVRDRVSRHCSIKPETCVVTLRVCPSLSRYEAGAAAQKLKQATEFREQRGSGRSRIMTMKAR